jgi:teichuronic acid biosynthesis glycosyltransferase TuaC
MMKVLIVCSGNTPEGQTFDLRLHHAFIYEQVEAVRPFGIEFDYFLIKGRGPWGYVKHYKKLLKSLENGYDLVHAHNGFCGFIANLQNKIPVITTFHGSDINLFFQRLVSYFPLLKSSRSIFVSNRQLKKVLFKNKIIVIPCGIDLKVFYQTVRNEFFVSENNVTNPKKILFSSAFSIGIKNSPLAFKAISKIEDNNIVLSELKNKTRQEVNSMLNTSNLLLLTSFSEGSPMVIKEAMACNCPIVSTDVGDVREVFGNTDGCYITSFDPQDVADKIKLALEFSQVKGRTNGRNRIIELGLDSESIAKRIVEVYKEVLKVR